MNNPFDMVQFWPCPPGTFNNNPNHFVNIQGTDNGFIIQWQIPAWACAKPETPSAIN